MDRGSPGGRVQDWVMAHFQGQQEVSRGQLVAEERVSDLPDEVRAAIESLPEGSWSPQRAVHHIVDLLEERASDGARGNANIPGPGGYGKSR